MWSTQGTRPNKSMLLIFAPTANGNVGTARRLHCLPGTATGMALIPIGNIPSRAAADRFALLTRLPSLASLEEKSRALAEAAYATTACTSTTVVVFTDEHSSYGPRPKGGGFTLREGTRGLRRLFLPALAKFARGRRLLRAA